MKQVGLAINCADIGSITNDNFGWAAVHGEQQRDGTTIDGLVDDVVQSLAEGVKVALGFECPLWVPVPDDPSGLTAKRGMEGDKPWSAAAGACALAAGLTETAWILRQNPPGPCRQGCVSAVHVFELAGIHWRRHGHVPMGSVCDGGSEDHGLSCRRTCSRRVDRLQGVRSAFAQPGSGRRRRYAACGAVVDRRSCALVTLGGGPGVA